MSDKLDDIGELYDRFYRLYGELYGNRMLLDNAKTYNYMGAQLFEQFRQEYERLIMQADIAEKDELYAMRLRHNAYVPRRRWIFRNRAAKQSEREIMQEITEYFRRREEALERLITVLDNADDGSALQKETSSVTGVTERGG